MMMNNNEIIIKLIEAGPLYKSEPFHTPILVKELYINSIDYFCNNCRKERQLFKEFKKNKNEIELEVHLKTSTSSLTESTSKEYSFICSKCKTRHQFWLIIDCNEMSITKVGQFPPWNVNIDKTLNKYLGDNSIFYKKGLICLSQSYGIGACSYFRRVIENVIQPLLEILIQKKRHEGSNSQEIDDIINTSSGKSFKDKAKLAMKITPNVLIINNINPFKVIHDFLSHSIHEQSEQDSLENALKIKETIDFLVHALYQEQEMRAHYSKTISNITVKT